jgi:hypothetical protein
MAFWIDESRYEEEVKRRILRPCNRNVVNAGLSSPASPEVFQQLPAQAKDTAYAWCKHRLITLLPRADIEPRATVNSPAENGILVDESLKLDISASSGCQSAGRPVRLQPM